MERYPQLKALILGVGMAMLAGSALAGSWGTPTMGDSASQEGWGATIEANGLDPRGLGPVMPDANGLGPYRVPVSHTPTGQLYSVPWMEADPTKTLTGGIEIGGMYTTGDNKAQKWEEYRDMSDGIFINHFNFSASSGTTFLNIEGGGVGREDQYYNAQFGEYNNWKIRGFYDSDPHVYETNFRSIYTGVGTGSVSLVPALQFTGAVQTLTAANPAVNPGNTLFEAPIAAGTANIPGVFHAVQSVVASSPDSTLEQLRKKGGLRFDKDLGDNWSVYASYTLEKRNGAMPYGTSGGGFPGNYVIPAINSPSGTAFVQTNPTLPAGVAFVNANGNGQGMEVPYPIDFSAHEFLAGISWANELNSVNAAVHASIFNDSIKQVIFQDPFASPTAATNRNFQNFTTFPDNQAYDFKVDYQRLLPNLWNGSWNVTASVGTQRNNSDLFPGDVATGFTGAGNTGVNLAYWNSLYVDVSTGKPCSGPSSSPNCLPTLSQQSSDLHNNLYLFSTALTLHPTDQLSVNGKWKYYDQVNTNNYVAYNPACAANPVGCGTGAYGYEYEDAQGNDQGTNAGAATGTVQCAVGAFGSVNNCANDAGNRVQSFNASWRQIDTDLGGDFRINAKNSVSANFEREDTNRTNRERDWTYENKLKLGFVSKELTGGTLRLSAEYDKRTGSDYNNSYSILTATCPDAAYNVSQWWLCLPPLVGVGGTPIGNIPIGFGGISNGTSGAGAADPNMEGNKYDLSDRNQYVLIGRFNYMLTNTLDGMITARDQTQLYPENPFGYGREHRNDMSLTGELNWQISTVTSAYVYDTWQVMNQSQASADAGTSACTLGAQDQGLCNDDPLAANSYFAAITNAFRYDMEDTNNMLGAGFSHLFENKSKFDASYQYQMTRTKVTYTDLVPGNCAGGQAAIGIQGLPFYGCPAVIPASYTNGDGLFLDQLNFPDEVWDRQTLNLGYSMPVTASTAVRFSYTFDKATEADWHYDGLCAYNNAPGAHYFLSCNPSGGFKNQTIAVFLNWKL